MSNSMICFFAWGTKINGGVQNIIINISDYLSKRNTPVTIVGYEYCFIVKTLNDLKVNFHFIDIQNTSNSKLKKELNGKVLVLTSLKKRFGLKNIYKANPNILFWNVFPPEITTVNKLGPLDIRFLTKRLIKYLIDNNGCVFMDGFCYDELLNFEKKLNLFEDKSRFLPVPVKVEKVNNYLNRTNPNNSLNISYVGRGTLWKINPLLKVIEDLIKINFNCTINIFVISQEKSLYQEKIRGIKLPENFKIYYRDNLTNINYTNFLKCNIDINISMGTAALDSAAQGIPTLLIDYSFSKMPDNYKYNWLYETKRFGLGYDAHNTTNKHELVDVLKPFISKFSPQIKKISTLSYEYVKLNHSVENISSDLQKKVKETKASAQFLYGHSPLVNNCCILFALKIFNNTLNRYNARLNS